MTRTFIIAEAGVNHGGSLDIAKTLVERAKDCGADAVKFQSFRADKLVSKWAEKAEYQKHTTSASESQYRMLKNLEFSGEDHGVLVRHCREMDIAFLSSPFDEESADLLHDLNVPLFKIPSGEITNIPLLRHIAGKKRPIILSTGMSTLGEIEEALAAIRETGNQDVSLLHCVSQYPAPYREINLGAMDTIRACFHVPVGFSDHTEGIEIAIAAVALGATIIEKHFTLSREMEGPDHKASSEPDEFRKLVEAIRNVELSMGDGIKRPASCEMGNIWIARKSVVAKSPIKPGEKFTEQNITLKRPGYGIQPKDVSKIVGMEAKIPFDTDDVITWDKVK
jgi:N,N'-diacetyllegionaminate synthase